MAESRVAQLAVEQPVLYPVDDLLTDVRPLRALFEELALQVRNALRDQGIAEPWLEAALDLQYREALTPLTVPFLLEFENVAVCLADPLPLDNQALRQAVAAFRVTTQERTGMAAPGAPIQVVMARLRGSGSRA